MKTKQNKTKHNSTSKHLKVQHLLFICLFILFIPFSAQAETWNEILQKGKGQTVYWNAWGGSDEINSYIQWVSKNLKTKYDVNLKHVKLANTADAVARVLAEKTAGRTNKGSIDLIWINGENFANMKQNDLLFGPFTQNLPNFDLVDFKEKPTTLNDFQVPVEGFEAPWGMAKFNFVYDSKRINKTPETMFEFQTWTVKHPGRFTYPHVSDFLGSTFLMQALMELSNDAKAMKDPVKNTDQFQRVSKPLWDFLHQLHPNLWRSGKSFPASNTVQRQMLNDSELDIALSFNPSDTSSAIVNGTLPVTARTFVLKQGTIGNTHFVAIPFNSSSKAGSMIVANYLMSPEAQAQKQNPEIWGDSTVLAIKKLNAKDQQKFKNLPLGVATLAPEKLGPTLINPHPDWKNKIDAEWEKRYGQ